MTDVLVEYLQVIRDPAHLLAEATFILVEAAVIRKLFLWWHKRHDRTVHGG